MKQLLCLLYRKKSTSIELDNSQEPKIKRRCVHNHYIYLSDNDENYIDFTDDEDLPKNPNNESTPNVKEKTQVEVKNFKTKL